MTANTLDDILSVIQQPTNGTASKVSRWRCRSNCSVVADSMWSSATTHDTHSNENVADKVTLNELLAPSPPPYTPTQGGQQPGHDSIVQPDDTFRAMLADLFDDINRTCAKLYIPHDPRTWSREHTSRWLGEMLSRFDMRDAVTHNLTQPGHVLCAWPQEEFCRRAPYAGAKLYAQLSIWKTATELRVQAQCPEPQTCFSTLPKLEARDEDDCYSDVLAWSPSKSPAPTQKYWRYHLRSRGALAQSRVGASTMHACSSSSGGTSPTSKACVKKHHSPNSDSGVSSSVDIDELLHSFGVAAHATYDALNFPIYTPTQPFRQRSVQRGVTFEKCLPHFFQTAHTSGVMARSASSSSDHNNNSRQCNMSRESCGGCLSTNRRPMSTLSAGYAGTSPSARQRGTTAAQHTIHLWQFLRELLDADCITNDRPVVRWLDRSAGTFKIENSHELARLWGQRKNRVKMNYDKLSRSLRQYYKKGILKKTGQRQRLIYQFCPPYNNPF